VQVLGLLEGVDVFDLEPLDSSRIGTLADPIKVFSAVRIQLQYLKSLIFFCPFPSLQDSERIVGCTGSPCDSHDVLWLRVTTEKTSRCPECGSGVCFVCCSSLLTTFVDVFHSVRHRLCTGISGCVGSCPSRSRACALALISREKP